MNERPTTSSDDSTPVGGTRIFWHPLLMRLLRWILRGGYEVRDELTLGEMPVRLDALLVRQESGQLAPAAMEYAPELLPLLRRRTLIEFTGPTDDLKPGDYERLLAYAMLYLTQEKEPFHNRELSLVLIAPALTAPFRNRLALRDLTIDPGPTERGVHRLVGGPIDCWVIETDEMARLGRPLLSLVSRVFVQHPRGIIDSLVSGAYRQAALYVIQQVKQFQRKGGPLAMILPDIGEPGLDPEVVEDLLQMLPLEKRLQGMTTEDRLSGLPPEVRLKGLAPEDRMEGLSIEDRMEGLTPEDRMEGLTPEDRMEGLSIEDRMEGLTPEDRQRLKRLLEESDKGDG